MSKKKDIRIEKALTWDEYKDKPLDQALPSIYDRACSTASTFADWYWSSIKKKRTTSLWVRSVTFVLLVGGTLAPLIAGICAESDTRLRVTQLGVCALALGGLLQVADRVFGWSSGWIRYITTATAMENLDRRFELDWAAYVLTKGGALSQPDVKPLFDMAAELESALMKLQTDETEKWQAEFGSGAAVLSDLIKSSRESAEKRAESEAGVVAAQKALQDAAAKASKPGALEVTLGHAADPVEVVITLDDEDGVKFVGKAWAVTDVAPGQHRLSVVPTAAPAAASIRIVDVPAGGVARVEIKL